jgi:signal transduction histidine kinase
MQVAMQAITQAILCVEHRHAPFSDKLDTFDKLDTRFAPPESARPEFTQFAELAEFTEFTKPPALAAECVVRVHTLAEAQQAMQSHAYGAVICDVAHTGFAALRELRNNAASLCIIIALVPTADYYAAREALHYGADDVLLITASADELHTALHVQQAKHGRIHDFVQRQLRRLARNITRALPHEFRTPLNSLMGFTHLLRDRQNLSSENMDEAIGYIQESAQRLHRTAEKFLLYAELERLATCKSAGRIGERIATEQICELVGEVVIEEAFVRHRAADLVLHLHLDGNAEAIVMQSQYMQFMMSEIISNACTFSPVGTPIKVRSAVRERVFVLRVSDCGSGMTATQIENIATFNQFNREEYEQQGVGLGLPIVKKIVEIFGGYCTMHTNTQGGLTVEIGLPLAAADGE